MPELRFQLVQPAGEVFVSGQDLAEADERPHDGAARQDFHRRKAEGSVSPDARQKEYFQGRDPLGRPATAAHTTRIQPPKLRRDAGAP